MVVKFILCSFVIIFSFPREMRTTSTDLIEIPHNKRNNLSTIRLSNTTEPIAYELWLETRFHEGIQNYVGRVRIAIRALEAADTITIHSDDLDLSKYALFDHLSNSLNIINHEEQKDVTLVTFFLEDNLRVGQTYVLDIEFTGLHRSSGGGFCQTRYVNENGEVFYTATSLLYMTYARTVFPCYDEPRYRTPFVIHLTHHASLTAASNMPIARITNNSNETSTTSFQETIPMPVNLVAFTICNYDNRKIFLEDKNLEISFLVPKHLTDELDFAIDFMKFMLNKLEDYLGVGYNLPKLEAVVINDVMHTGVENWGLMVFDSKCLLYNEYHTTPSQKMDIARTICHLLTHNYFGNIVGMSWWSYAWMTEGFAYYYEYYFTGFYLTDFPLEESFVVNMIQRFLPDNSRIISKPLNNYVEARNDVINIFNFAMVTKAGGIIRMCEHTFGKIFQKGLQNYIRDMSFQIAQPNDFYRSIQEAVSEDNAIPEDIKVGEFLSSWTEQPGYPLLTVMRNYQSNEIVVNQQRFLSSREEQDPEGLSWYIPLSISTAKNPDMKNTKPRVWLKKGMREMVVRTMENLTWSSEDWVLFNIQQTGYFRVNYDTENWKLLADELHRGHPYTIGTLNRAQLIDDSFNLAYSDIVEFTVALDIIKYIKYDDEYSVWVSANRHLLNMIRKLDSPSYELYFGRFLRHLTEDHFAKLDVFENTNGKDSVTNAFLRPIIVDLACYSRSRMCQTATRTMVTAEALTGHVLVPHERPAIFYCHGLKNADENTFQYFWRRLKILTNQQERAHIIHSIGCYHNSESFYSLLLETVDPVQNSLYAIIEKFQMIVYAVRNGQAKTVVRFLKENQESIAQIYTFNTRMEDALKEIAECLDEEDHEDYSNVLDDLVQAGHITSVIADRCKFEMEYHRKWVEENKNKIEDWIADFFKSSQENSALMVNIYTPVLFIAIGQALLAIF